MSALTIGALSLPLLLALISLRLPIGVAMFTVGALGYVVVSGLYPLLNYLKTGPYFVFQNYSLSVIPLFILMGQFASHAGISQALFRAAHIALGHRRGGLAMASIAGCAAFGAICGSSLATAATMAKVALPEMRRYGYSGALSTGTLAAGGTLGILIPPSVILVIYAVLTEQNIAEMFIAALVPSLLAIIGFMLTVTAYVSFRPDEGPAAAPVGRRRNWREFAAIVPVAVIFTLVIGGIYGGYFTPTEGAAVGAVATAVLALARGRLDWPGFKDCLLETATATAMVFLILLGADVFNAFLALTRLPMEIATNIAGFSGSPLIVVCLIVLIYLVMGCVLDSMAMILLTIPIFFPIVMALDFGMAPDETAIWFGIIALMVVELGLITPPIGLNVFVINALAPDVRMRETFRGILPFFIVGLFRIGLVILFPGVALWLVR